MTQKVARRKGPLSHRASLHPERRETLDKKKRSLGCHHHHRLTELTRKEMFLTMGGSTLSKQKGNSKKRKKTIIEGEIAPLYKEALGMQGVKRLRTDDADASPVAPLPLTKQEKKRRKERKARFAADRNTNGTTQQQVDPLYRPLSAPRNSKGEDKRAASHGRLVGENQNLEKPYLRLTGFPKKEDVRPFEVLVKALAHIKRRYIHDEDFEWANEQLKSVRQDITVQGIRNPFVLDVYETHARILLEHGDLNEFNQCQSVIRNLVQGGRSDSDELTTENGVTAKKHSLDNCDSNKPLCQSKISKDEFLGYALLYALVQKSWIQLKTELARARASVDAEQCRDRESTCFHALQVVKSVTENDYRTFFRLYESAPHMSAYLMDFLVKRVRDDAYERICAAYRPNVSVEHFREWLHFQDLEETRRFLKQRGAVFVEEKGEPLFWVDCKASK